MKFHPILSALSRHKIPVILMVLQIALTLAIVSNAVYIIIQRVERLDRPTGLNETNLIRISFQWPNTLAQTGGLASVDNHDALQEADLSALRNLPDVQSAAASMSVPLMGALTTGHLTLTRNGSGISVRAAYYYGDEFLRSTLGLRLISGRDFRADEVTHGTPRAVSPVVIVSKSLADKLFPNDDALGKTIYQDGNLTRIIGIVERLQASTVWKGNDAWAYNSVLEPIRVDGSYVGYVVRTRAGSEKAVLSEIREKLFSINPMRIMPETWGGITPFSEIRARAYRSDRGVALLMSLMCGILLIVTGAGVIALTSFWVTQRHWQIGVRRALGARRIDIRLYFQIENLFISSIGCFLGLIFALGLNRILMIFFELTYLPLKIMLLGSLALIVLCQLAALLPAIRASRISPIAATRLT